jgi:uncharacterized protein (TIGR03435 family)
MRLFAGITFTALLAGLVLAQTDAPPPTFEIADVHPSAPNQDPYMRGVGLRGDHYELRNATMLDLIARAYGVEDEKVLGGPNWLELDRFDVIAKTPRDATPDTAKLMLQALLADRFKLVVHMDTKPVPGFVLTLGKGKPKMKESDGSGNTGCEGVPQTPAPATVPYAMVTCRNVTMEMFAQELHRMAGAYIDNSVVDSTGLKGSWDFDIKWTARALLGRAGADGITIFDAVDKELGLKLEAQKVPASVMVVDSADEKPKPNPPEVAKLVPSSVPTEFEVAEIKPSQPDARQMGRIQNGRLELQAFSLKQLIRLAWDINADDMIANEPKWLDSGHFNLIAKVSTSGPVQQVDFDELRVMVRALLADRFQLKTHLEDRPVTAYTLMADKPKLTKADPANRTGCKEGAPAAAKGKDPRDANPMLARLVTCQNMSMAQFAQQLQGIAPGYIHNTVIDATGIEGSFDFTLSFSPIGLFQSAGARAGDGGPTPATGGGQQSGGAQQAGTPAASDPSGAVSLFEAVKKQLGLKLDMQKRTLPVLVIDHAEEKPTEN